MKQAILHNCTPTARCRRTTTGRLLLITLLLFTFLGGAKAQETTLTVCDGSVSGTTTTTNSYVPIYGLLVDQQGQNSEFIIPAETEGMSDLTGGTISKLAFYITNSPDTWGSPTVQVYMGEVEGTTLSSLNGPTDFTTVWTGKLSNQNATMEITLNTPYTYEGGNLLIGMYVQTKSSTFKGTSFSGITAPSGSSRYNSGSGSGYAQEFLPKTTFTYTPGSGTICKKPFLAVSNITDSGATLTVSGGSGTYNVEYKIAADDTWTSVATNTTETTFALSGLDDLTAYEVRVQSVCDASATSDWKTASFSTTAVLEAVGDSWSDNFEGTKCSWELINGGLTNAWSWGEATSNGGTHALYISNDGGTTNAYTYSSGTKVFATKLLNFADSRYEFSYDWMANGESTYDFLRVALVPATETLTAGTDYSSINSSSLPTGWIALDGGGKLSQVTAWQNKTLVIDVAAGNYYLVVAWRNDTSQGNNPPAAIDNVSISRVTCSADVEDLAASSITTTGATLTWTAGDATQWQIAYSASGTFENATEEIVSTASYDMTGLQSGTSYYVKVRAYCGGSDFGAWSEVLKFNTEMETITAYPWEENFDNYTGVTTGVTNVLPLGWNYINTCTYSSYKGYPVIYNSSYSNSPNNHLKFNSYAYYDSNGVTTYNPQPQYAILPQMQNVSNLRMKLYARAYSTTSSTYYDATFHVGIMTNPADATTFTEVASYNPSSTTYEQYTIPFNTYTGNGTYIAIKIDKADLVSGYSSIYHSVCIDDILVEEIPDCIEPTDLAEVENTATTQSVTFGWTANNGETTWKVQYKKGDATDWTTVSEPVTSNPYTLSGLDASSVYQVRVAAWCTPSDPEGISGYSNPITVKTACVANTVDADHHYTENFNAYTASTGTSAPTGYPDDELPLCWQFLNRSTNTSSYPMVFLSSYSGYHVSGNCLFFKSSSTTPLYAILPEFTNNISDLMLTFTYRNESTTTSNGTLIVGYMTDPTDAATFTAVHTCDRTTTLTEQEVLFADAPAGSYIAFEYQGGSSSNFYLAIDDVMVGLIPSCKKPSSLAKDATTAHTATLHWTNGVEGQDAWQIAYSTTADFNPDEVTPVDVTTNPATIEGLTQSTNYYAYVRANCGNGDYSAWCKTKASFTTPAGNVTPTSLAVDASTITTNQATVSWSGVAGNELHQSYDIYWAPATVTEVPAEPAAPNLITGITATSQTITGLEAETGYKVWVRDNCGTDGYSDWSSATTFTTASSCQTPDGLAASEVTLTSAKINWNTYGLTSFNLRYSDDKGNTWTTVEDVNSPYTFPNNLTVSTPYQVQVQATCNTAEWSEVLSFRTKCDVITITDSHHFIEDFEDPVTTAVYNTSDFDDLVMPPCWDNYTGNTSSSSAIPHIIKSGASYNYSNPASQVLYFYGSGNGYAALPEFSNPLNELQISFKWATESNSYGLLTLGYITNEDNGTYNTFTPIGESFKASNGASYQSLKSETVYLNTVPAEATRLVFRWYYSLQWSCNIDDVEVSLSPSCYPVGTVSAATDVTYNSAKLSWALIDDTQDEWIVQYATNATFTEGVGTKTATTNTNYELTGLTPETPYWVRVKAACSTTDDWSNVITFETEEFCAVTGVTAENITTTTADLSWDGGSDSYNIRYGKAPIFDAIFTEGFEDGIGEWTMVHCASSTGITDDDSYVYSGSKAFNFAYNTNPPQYLISPELTGVTDGMKLEFWYKNSSSSYSETFQIGTATTTSTDIGEIEYYFTFGAEITASDAKWHHYSETIPAGTKYICWKLTSNDKLHLCIDDIQVGSVVTYPTTTVSSTTTTAQLTGLTAGTKYEVQVQGVCDGTPGNWSTPACYFTTFDGLELADNDSEKAPDKKNSYLISHDDGTEKNVMLLGRKLWKDGNWNTLCLPFNMTAEQVTAQLNPAINGLMELDVTNKWSLVNNQWSMDDNGTYQTGLDTDGTLYLYFKNASEITANKPYIIKWDASDPNYIQNPVFTGVTIDDSRYDVEFTGGMFVGTRDYTKYYDREMSILFLGDNNTLYYPQPDLTDPDNPVYPSIGAFRAYFQLDTTTPVRAFRLSFGDGDETQGINSLTPDPSPRGEGSIYSVGGMKFDKMPKRKGVYIMNGRKVVIK